MSVRVYTNIVLVAIALVCAQNLCTHFVRHHSFATCVICVDKTLRTNIHFAHKHCSDHEEEADYTSFGTLIRAAFTTCARPILFGCVYSIWKRCVRARAKTASPRHSWPPFAGAPLCS